MSTACPEHWRGKHDWRGPGGMKPPADGPYSGIVGGGTHLLRCARCGVAYVTANARPGAITLRDVVLAARAEATDAAAERREEGR